jgi:hypothetical protein
LMCTSGLVYIRRAFVCLACMVHLCEHVRVRVYVVALARAYIEARMNRPHTYMYRGCVCMPTTAVPVCMFEHAQTQRNDVG